jgi:hypothetical protein
MSSRCPSVKCPPAFGGYVHVFTSAYSNGTTGVVPKTVNRTSSVSPAVGAPSSSVDAVLG